MTSTLNELYITMKFTTKENIYVDLLPLGVYTTLEKAEKALQDDALLYGIASSSLRDKNGHLAFGGPCLALYIKAIKPNTRFTDD